MSTALTIVRRALRLMGVLGPGAQPTGVDQADCLERLQSVILGLPGLTLNGRWSEVASAAAYTAKESERIMVTGAWTITLPLTVTPDGGDTRPPLDLARVLVVGADATIDYSGDEDGGAGLWLYSASKGAWGRADGLTISSELPFGAEDDEGLSAKLAMSLVDEYGASLGPVTVQAAEAFTRSVRARLKRSAPVDYDRPGFYPARFGDYA